MMATNGRVGGGCSNKGTELQWKFSQVFGDRAPEEPIHDVDIVSAVEFDKKGDYLATGDHGGRVVVFERKEEKVVNGYSRKELEHMNCSVSVHPRYMYKTEFQSHEPEFDYLKSLEIEEKINKLRWCAALNNSLFILSTNHRTIKLWKIVGQKAKKIKEMQSSPHVCVENALLAENSFMTGQGEQSVPNTYRLEWINKKSKRTSDEFQEGNSLMPDFEEGTSRCRKVYAHAHEYNINSISVNSDCETFLSADDLRINLWNTEIINQCFNIIDMRPSNMEDLIEVITSAEFHPSYCNILAYSSSRGLIRLVDMRKSALCDQSARILQDREVHASKSLFTEIISSISDIKFTTDGMHILGRDYMNLKLWDLRMESSPISSFKIHEYLRPKLSELYNSDSIFDKFECCVSGDGLHLASGSYSNIFRVFSRSAGSEDGTTLEASKNPNRTPVFQTTPKAARLLPSFARGSSRRGNGNSSCSTGNGILCDATSKLTHLAWHPTTNLIACAAANSLYMFHA